jgi:ferric enterobactin receptor
MIPPKGRSSKSFAEGIGRLPQFFVRLPQSAHTLRTTGLSLASNLSIVRKIVLALTSSLFFAMSLMAQQPSAAGAGGARPGGPPSIGRAFGKITDSTGQPIPAASVLLLKAGIDPAGKKKKLILLKGMDTKANGEFNFEDLPIVGSLVLRVSASGYKSRDISFTIMTPGGTRPAPAAPAGQGSQGNGLAALANIPSFDKDLGSVKLETNVEELAGVTVTSSLPTMKLELDKKVFNVEKNIVSAGGTALDVMRNVPSVNVDIDGNVSLRGNTPTIYVDGRPTTLTLDEIPADAIESVEVMTNPSAKYDASASGGILNIVLKKNRKKGYNGNISAGIDSHGAPNGLASFNVRENKVNFTGTFLINDNKSKTTGNTNRLTTLSQDTATRLLENDLTHGGGGFQFGQVGADYFASNKTTLSASFLQVHGSITPTETSQLQTDSIVNAVTGPTSYSTRYSNSNLAVNVYGGQAGIKHTFDKKDEEWTADGSYFAANATSTANYLTNYYEAQPGSAIGLITQQQTLAVADPRFFTFQSDYTDPLGAKSKLEAGVRASIQKLTDDNNTYSADGNGHYVIDTLAASDYSSTSSVYAGYVNFTSAFKDFGYQLGLRGESSNYTGKLYSTNMPFSNQYPLSLFPSVFLSQKFGKTDELQFSATRKVTRPSFFQLIPYTNYSDTLNITRGNPALVPQFTEDFEFSYLKTFPHNNTLLLTTYYNYTSNLITRYQETGTNPNGEEVLINTYENANDSYSYGVEATTTNTVTRWCDLSLNLNLYNSQINTDNLDQPSQAALWSWFGKFNSNFKLPSDFTVQMTATYQSKTNLPVNTNTQSFGPPNSQTLSASQGYIKAFYGVDMAIKKTFLKNNAASLTLSVSDIFRTRWSDQFSESQYFTQEFDRLKDPQLVRLVFAYHFGKMDLSLFKRKDMHTQGMGDAGQSLQ